MRKPACKLAEIIKKNQLLAFVSHYPLTIIGFVVSCALFAKNYPFKSELHLYIMILAIICFFVLLVAALIAHFIHKKPFGKNWRS
ncbi:hypothetical protein [Spirosoma sp. 209]|uniref:Uncharacterized protein n=1 Tax=Spirosoma sordidisoli TaxID=2502893 RepID=A0A4Q2UVG0_9BACT|nr:hypothetical protein [Spirosoma sp. 209]RYC71855.1 hypothetical protein EQG79_06930 [Spirosoma sordidisoli]